MLNLSAIFRENDDVPFLSQIKSGNFSGHLLLSKRKNFFLIHPDRVGAIAEGNFIAFTTRAEAEEFIRTGLSYRGPGEFKTAQEAYEESRTRKPVKFKYTGVVEQVE